MSINKKPEPMNDIGKTSFLKIEGRIFSLSEIAKTGIDFEDELKQYYNERYQKHIAIFNDGVVAGLTNDWEGQIQKLRDHADRQSVVIPTSHVGCNKPVVCLDGRSVSEVRAVLYSPNIFKMQKYDVAHYCNIEGVRETNGDTGRSEYVYDETLVLPDKTKIDLNDYDEGEVLLVEVMRKHFFSALYSFDARSDRLNCLNLATFHSQGSYAICTGRHKASAFWKSPDFETLVNTVNCFSLGHASVEYRNANNPVSYGLNEFVNRNTILSITREKEKVWRT